MKTQYQVAFWITTFIVLTLSFGRSYGGYAQSFYFVAFLFPVILGTSIFFNSHLIPRYLLKKKYLKFVQFSVYTLIFSVYFEILVITLSLVVFANYQYNQMNPKTTDIVLITVIMYLLVFLNTIVVVLNEYFRGQEKNRELETEQARLKQGHLVVKSDRKNVNIPYGDITYIESVGNYIRIIPASGKPIMTKEKIGTIITKLPHGFLRIHRSIIVNSEHITSHNRECVNIRDTELPISRKYKETALTGLNSI